MYHLRNLINRSSIPSNPEKNMNAAEDFLLLLLHTHVVAAARVMQSINPTANVADLAKLIIINYVRLPRSDDEDTEKCEDGVHLYAIELLSLGLLWHGFHDAIREGDGERILRYWKFMLVVFKSTNHRNYAKEAVNLLLQYHYTFSEREKAQLLWSRCVNTRGHPGANIPCDLFMEHLNRRLKTVIRSMRANVNPSSIQKAGKSIASVYRVCQQFELQTSSQVHSDHHPYPSFGKDFDTTLKALEEQNVFLPVSVRLHSTFKFTCGLMESLSRTDMLKKVETTIKQIYLV